MYLAARYELSFAHPGRGKITTAISATSRSLHVDHERRDVRTHLQDTAGLLRRLAGPMTNLPAVSYIKPSGIVDGHPNSSKLICSRAS